MDRRFLLWFACFAPISLAIVLGSITALEQYSGRSTPQKDAMYAEPSLSTGYAGKGRDLELFRRLIDCASNPALGDENWNAECERAAGQIEQSASKDGSSRTPWLIVVIYVLLASALNVQMAVLMRTRTGMDPAIRMASAELADWAINTAPILGVLGTVVSFALLVGGGKEDFERAFLEGFYNAAITTILGGCIYVFNLFLNVWIRPRLLQE